MSVGNASFAAVTGEYFIVTEGFVFTFVLYLVHYRGEVVEFFFVHAKITSFFSISYLNPNT